MESISNKVHSVKDALKQATYFDFESDCKIRRKPDSILRSLIRQYMDHRKIENDKLK